MGVHSWQASHMGLHPECVRGAQKLGLLVEGGLEEEVVQVAVEILKVVLWEKGMGAWVQLVLGSSRIPRDPC